MVISARFSMAPTHDTSRFISLCSFGSSSVYCTPCSTEPTCAAAALCLSTYQPRSHTQSAQYIPPRGDRLRERACPAHTVLQQWTLCTDVEHRKRVERRGTL